MIQGGCDQSLGHVRLRMWALEKVSSALWSHFKAVGYHMLWKAELDKPGISPVPSNLWWSPTMSLIPSLAPNWFFDSCKVPGYSFVVILFLSNSFIGIYFVYHMIHAARMSGAAVQERDIHSCWTVALKVYISEEFWVPFSHHSSSPHLSLRSSTTELPITESSGK